MSLASPILDLNVLGLPPGLPALTPSRGQFYAEAAAYCLENQNHSQGVELSVRGVSNRQIPLAWPSVTEQIRQAYNDTQDSTSFGAYGIAIMLAKELIGMTVLLQSRKGTGFDYWIGSNPDDLFQSASRLEVSGILNGDDSIVKKRVNQKKKQTQQSDATGLPAYACVVEFGSPLAHFVKR